MEPNGTSVRDGTHSLCVYKCETEAAFADPDAYLGLPSRLSQVAQAQAAQEGVNSAAAIVSPGQRGDRGGAGIIRAAREAVKIRTKLCSTKLTQNG